MKEIKSIEKDKVEIVAQQQIKKQENFVGTISLVGKKGNSLYKMSTKTGIITKVDVEQQDLAHFDKRKSAPLKAKFEKDYLYAVALNDKNAKRKFEQMVNKLTSQSK